MIQVTETENDLITSFFESLRPPPNYTIDEWADKNIQLPRGSPEPGPWRTSRVPYMREIFRELSPVSHATDITFMKGSQVSATTAMIVAKAFYIAHTPGPIMIVQPTIGDAEDFSTGKLQPLFNECEKVKNVIYKSKSRDGSNTILKKSYPGGTLFIGGANSAPSLASKTIQYLDCDEIDRYPDDVDGEGDPIDIVEKRTSNYARVKRFYASTPTIAQSSKIESRFKASDQRYYYVPCPYCDEKQIIKWENIVYKDDAGNIDLKHVYLKCIKCEGKIYEHFKNEMLEKGEWRKHKPENEDPGFHLSGLYSPLGWYSWRDGVKAHLKSISNPVKRKVWVNTFLGETWEELTSANIDPEWLRDRSEIYTADVPSGALILTLGVDTQDNRLEVQLIGWGINHESWIIDYEVFEGDPDNPEVWLQLDRYMQRSWSHENGSQMSVACTCVDARGHRTDSVYAYCAQRRMRNVFPILGQPGSGRQLIIRRTQSQKAKTTVFHIGVDGAKSTLYARLMVNDNEPGRVHFPKLLPSISGEPRELNDQYFQGLTAERKVEYRRMGMPAFKWELPAGKRNEPLDTYVYAMAALQIVNPNLELYAKENRTYNKIQLPQRPARRVINSGIQV